LQRGHKDVYWFRLNVLTSSGELLMLLEIGSIVGLQTAERGMSSHVSSESEVELKCLRLVKKISPESPGSGGFRSRKNLS
jgi:hypothetical protein